MDAVLLIGEHGEYPSNEKNQVLYPRYEFFKECVEVFEEDGRAVPIYNDKHLSYSFEKAKGDGGRWTPPRFWRFGRFIFTRHVAAAGPRTAVRVRDRGGTHGRRWRFGSDGLSRFRSDAMYDRTPKGLAKPEPLLCSSSKARRSGKPVKMDAGHVNCLAAALSRSDTPCGLTDEDGRTQDLLGTGELQRLVENPSAYFIEYNDGLKATLLMLNGAVRDYCFAAQLKDASMPGINPVFLNANPERYLLGVSHCQD